MNEFFYGETLRWSFGFENPNKAAVIFACLLPLCWWAWAAAWGIRRGWVRIPSLVVAAGAFLAAGTCLVMTFSRGGLVAGLVALGYVWVLALWRRWQENSAELRRFWDVGRPSRLPVCSGNSRRDARSTLLNIVASGAVAEASADGATPSRRKVRLKCWLSVLLVVALVCLAAWSGLAGRSLDGLGEDASVTHRFDLWRAGLQMAYENPAGFGSGRSGREFMQWYQATDRTEGYRTMVSSYLTFLVEQGRWMFALAAFGVLAFWFSTVPAPGRKTAEIAAALRASILAFLVAGLFSTTMEDWCLWIIPFCCSIFLVTLRCCSLPRAMSLRPFVWGLCATCAIVLGLSIAGASAGKGDPLARTFASSPEGSSVVAIAPKSAKKTIRFVPDEAVLGPMYGKLLRSLALESGSKTILGDGAGTSADLVVFAGEEVNGPRPEGDCPLVLLAPARMEEAQARAILDRKGRVLLLLPEIEEDGRSSFWRNLAGRNPRNGLVCRELGGVGTQVDWAWKQVVDCIRE